MCVHCRTGPHVETREKPFASAYDRLVGWRKVPLKAGESKSVTVPIDPLYLSIWDTANHAWAIVPGAYTIKVGGASNSTPLTGTFTMAASH